MGLEPNSPFTASKLQQQQEDAELPNLSVCSLSFVFCGSVPCSVVVSGLSVLDAAGHI